MGSLFADKKVLITGASRGIGKAIALKLAREGASIIIAAKSIKEDPRLGGTIFSAAAEVEAAGGKAFPIECDIRDEQQILHAVEQGAKYFGGIDILINNASAISLSSIEATESKRFDLMHDINVRGTFLMCKACIPWLEKSNHAHVLSLSPPLDMNMKWFASHVAYTISKYNMTMITLSIAEKFKGKIAANTLWPKTIIATAAIKILPGGEQLLKGSRKPEIVADAAYHILSMDPALPSGICYTDEAALQMQGVVNFDKYATEPGHPLFPDLFI